MAFPVVAATNTSTNADTTSHTVNLPPSISAGDLLIAVMTTSTDTAFTWPAGWTELYEGQVDATVRSECRFRNADGGEGGSITVTTAALARSSSLSYRITGHSDTPEGGDATGNDGFANPPSLTPSWGAKDTLWLALTGIDSQAVSADPTDYTDGFQAFAGGFDPGTASARRERNATSEDPGTFTNDLSDRWIAGTVAIEPSVAAAEIPAARPAWNYRLHA